MVESEGTAHPRWVDEIVARPFGWFAVFLVLAVALVAAMLAWWAAFGFWDTLFDPLAATGLSYDGRSHVTMTLLLAFVASGTAWVRQGARRDIEALGKSADVDPSELAETLARNAAAPRAVRVAALGAALVIGTAIIPLTVGPVLWSLEGWDLHHVWAIANQTAIFYLMIEGAWLAVQAWRTIGDYTATRISIDLLDRHALAAIGRIGLRGAALWLGGSTIASSLTWGITHLAPLLVILSVPLTLATVSLLLPAQMARRSLRVAKQRELKLVRARIAEARECALGDGRGDVAGAAALLPGLLAYEARIESVHEWPYDVPTIVRFGLLAVIAVGSWLGGALVERVLGSLLD